MLYNKYVHKLTAMSGPMKATIILSILGDSSVALVEAGLRSRIAGGCYRVLRAPPLDLNLNIHSVM